MRVGAAMPLLSLSQGAAFTQPLPPLPDRRSLFFPPALPAFRCLMLLLRCLR